MAADVSAKSCIRSVESFETELERLWTESERDVELIERVGIMTGEGARANLVPRESVV